jgi:hypothetical protein
VLQWDNTVLLVCQCGASSLPFTTTVGYDGARQDAEKVCLFTRPTPARQDAPSPSCVLASVIGS